MPCSNVLGCQRFGGLRCLHLLGCDTAVIWQGTNVSDDRGASILRTKCYSVLIRPSSTFFTLRASSIMTLVPLMVLVALNITPNPEAGGGNNPLKHRYSITSLYDVTTQTIATSNLHRGENLKSSSRSYTSIIDRLPADTPYFTLTILSTSRSVWCASIVTFHFQYLILLHSLVVLQYKWLYAYPCLLFLSGCVCIYFL